jgi:hypothetical protein
VITGTERNYNDKAGIIFLLTLIGAVFFIDICIEFGRTDPVKNSQGITYVPFFDADLVQKGFTNENERGKSPSSIITLGFEHATGAVFSVKLSLLFYLFASFSFLCLKNFRTDPGDKGVKFDYVSFVYIYRISFATPRPPPGLI